MVDEVGVLQNKGIPRRFLASQATGNKRLFLLGHCRNNQREDFELRLPKSRFAVNPQLPAAASRSDPIPETPYLLTHPWCRKKHPLNRPAGIFLAPLSSTQSLSTPLLRWHCGCSLRQRNDRPERTAIGKNR